MSKLPESSIVVLLPDVLLPEQAIGDTATHLPQPNWAAYSALSRSLARGNVGKYQRVEGDPLEGWFASVVGWRANDADCAGVHCPWAMLQPSQANLHQALETASPAANTRFFVSPVHLQVAQDGVYVLAPDALQLSASDAIALWSGVLPILEQAGWTPISMVSTLGYLMQAASGIEINMPSPWSGGQLDLSSCLPQGAALAPWRVLWMDVQMYLHAHPVNQARELQGLPAINAFWWWGGGGASWQTPYEVSRVSLVGQLGGAHRLQALMHGANDAEIVMPDACPKHLNTFVANTTGPHDWFDEAQVLREVSQNLLEPLIASGTPYSLVLTGQHGYKSISVNSNIRWRFWMGSPALRLMIEPSKE